MNRKYSVLDFKENSISYNPELLLRFSWKMTFSDQIKFKSFKTKNLIPDEIEKIIFEVIGDTYKSYGDFHKSYVYIIYKNSHEPVHFFSVEILQKMVLNNESEAFFATKEILEKVKSVYDIPFEYKLSVSSKQKDNMQAFLVFLLLLAMLVIGLLDKFNIK